VKSFLLCLICQFVLKFLLLVVLDSVCTFAHMFVTSLPGFVTILLLTSLQVVTMCMCSTDGSYRLCHVHNV